MSDHYAHVHIDRDYLRRLAALRRVTREDVIDAYVVSVSCADPAGCPGWEECREDHAGYDYDDPNSPAYGEDEGVLIHGVLHDYRHGWGWVIDYPGCPVLGFAPDQDFDEIDRTRPGTYLLDVDWDDDHCYMTAVERVSDTPTLGGER